MLQLNLDFAILTETKVTEGIYARTAEGYRVVATNAKSVHQA